MTSNKHGFPFGNFKLSSRLASTPLLLCLVLQGCVTTDPKTGQPSIKETFKQTFASDDPCANNARNIGIIAGAVLGGVVGNKVSNNKTTGTLLGVGLGGALGAFIGSEVDKRQCELSKIQKKYSLDMQVTPIAISTAAIPTNAVSTGTSTEKKSEATQKVGLSVSVVDVDGKPQFNSGSDELQPEAKQHFGEIAKQYSANTQVAQLGVGKTEEEKKKLFEELRKKRILLIGHTDDTGNSQANADLSEKRARAVARLFKSEGVDESQLYFQGAGETLPIADNATPEGRAKNRRVEIVDLTNEDAFKLYLQNRRAKTEYYRPAESNLTTNNSPVTTATPVPKVDSSATKIVEKLQGAKKEKTASMAKKSDKKAVATESSSVKAREAARSWIDFGGTPTNGQNTAVNIGEVTNEKINLLSKITLINEAYASDMSHIGSCYRDRPRDAGAVKSLKDGREYATSDYLPGVYDSSWAGQVNGHLVALTHVAVLRDGNAPARKPNLLVYRDYKAGSDAKPTFVSSPEVNVYRGDQAMLYRVFDSGAIQCMDIVIPNSNPKEAPNSTLFYNHGNTLYSATFSPKLAK